MNNLIEIENYQFINCLSKLRENIKFQLVLFENVYCNVKAIKLIFFEYVISSIGSSIYKYELLFLEIF
jgi:hypothetical protein